jgi:hypothetical protein
MHFNLGLMKNFVKTMNQKEAAFTHLRKKSPRLSETKLKEGIFIGPQIQDLIKDEYFDEKAAWDSFKFVNVNQSRYRPGGAQRVPRS